MILLLAVFTLSPSFASADTIVGETVVTLGKDLTSAQQTAILKEMNVNRNDPHLEILYVTNQEEYQYLGKYMSSATIGTHAISSTKITIADAGSGVRVKTHNITTITPAMYANAAVTAGLRNANIYVTAPFKVSGTAALTGIIKAYQEATGITISNNNQDVASEEIVRTQQIAEQIKDPNKAVLFMNRIKEEISKQNPQTLADYEKIVDDAAKEYKIKLDPDTREQLIEFAENYSDLNINWEQIKGQFAKLGNDASDAVDNVHLDSILSIIVGWIDDIVQAINDFFTVPSSTK